GHRRIAFFKGNPDNPDTSSRWRAVERGARRLRLEIRPERVFQLEDSRADHRRSGYDEGLRLGRLVLEERHGATALMAFNDFSAIGAIRAFTDAGLRVPQDLSVVGFDDVDNAEWTTPRLTTVRQPLEDMGELAARLLLAAVDPHHPAAADGQRQLDADLVVRGSTAEAA
ncbi:MAG: substrate-binding domain-containing protein, partial [Acidobacteriota bacterium]